MERPTGTGPEVPAGSGRGADGAAAAGGGAAAAASTGNAGAAAVVIVHDGQDEEPGATPTVGSGRVAAAEGAASAAPPTSPGNSDVKEKKDIAGESACGAPSQVKEEPVNAPDASGSGQELGDC